MSHKLISAVSLTRFQNVVWEYYTAQRRSMPWRDPRPDGTYDAYRVMVSEIMLQQTQVSRVLSKYEAFLLHFPNIQTLADASLADVLKVWSGLGYNRRAKFLWLAAQEIIHSYDGVIPNSVERLATLPGIGPNTGAAVIAYTFNQPVIFIETNIRTVFIHHFFNDETAVMDKDILALVKESLPAEDFRNWYYALMDYGSFLKSTAGNKSRQAKAYARQPTFKGSRRQLRGMVLRTLSVKPQGITELAMTIMDDRLKTICDELQKDGLIHLKAKQYILG